MSKKKSSKKILRDHDQTIIRDGVIILGVVVAICALGTMDIWAPWLCQKFGGQPAHHQIALADKAPQPLIENPAPLVDDDEGLTVEQPRIDEREMTTFKVISQSIPTITCSVKWMCRKLDNVGIECICRVDPTDGDTSAERLNREWKEKHLPGQ